MNYYIQQDDKIVIFDTDKEKLQTTLDLMPQYQGLEIQETERPIVLCDDCGSFEFADTDEYNQQQTEKRKQQFTTQFFNTSLGYVKRKVTMQDGSTKDFLSDILPLLQTDIPIITYNEPDFTKDELPTQNTNVIVTEDFINECKQQVLIDFYGGV